MGTMWREIAASDGLLISHVLENTCDNFVLSKSQKTPVVVKCGTPTNKTPSSYWNLRGALLRVTFLRKKRHISL